METPSELHETFNSKVKCDILLIKDNLHATIFHTVWLF